MRIRPQWIFELAACLYIGLAAQTILLPGIYGDEVLQAVGSLHFLRGTSPEIVQVSSIEIANRAFPVMTLPYLGSLQSWLLLIPFGLVGASVPVMRLSFVLVGLIPLALTFRVARQLFGGSVAAATTLLLATDASYIFSSRSDNGPMLVMLICKLAVMSTVISWWRRGQATSRFAGCFFVGLGLYDKLNFAWFLAALTLATAALYARPVWLRAKRLRASQWAESGMWAMLGAIPLAYYLILGGWQAVLGGLQRLDASKTSMFGNRNTDVWHALALRLSQLWDVLAGNKLLDFYMDSVRGMDQHVPYLTTRGLFDASLFPLTTLFAIAGILILGLIKRNAEWRKLIWLIAQASLMFVFSLRTLTQLSYHHLFILYPIPHLLSGWLLTQTKYLLNTTRLRTARHLQAVLFLPVFAMALINSGATQKNYEVLRETGGIGNWSDSIYPVAHYFENDPRTLIALSWGINFNIAFLSEGKLNVQEHWREYLESRAYDSKMAQLIQQPNQVYLMLQPEFALNSLFTDDIDRPRLTLFATAKQLGRTPHLEKQFFQRDGRLLLEVYTIQP